MYTDISPEVMAQSVEIDHPALNYNHFFHPNLCHVCKTADQSKIKSCLQCRMIYYCSEEHRLLHREQHEDICRAIVNLSKQINIWNSRDMTQDSWYMYKTTNCRFVRNKLNRDMLLYEMEMFLLAKSCFICHKQYNLTMVCDACKFINMCLDHQSAPSKHDCQELRICLKIDLYIAAISKPDKAIPESLFNLDTSTRDMKSFIEESLHPKRQSSTWLCKDYMYSLFFTYPLTTFFGLQDANLLKPMKLNSTVVIHIISGYPVDKNSLLAWEVILHLLPPKTTLLIEMVGMDLHENQKMQVTVQLCRECMRDNKKLLFRYFRMFYYYYVPTLREKPDVVIGFHVMFTNTTTTRENLKAIQRFKCPVILTSFFEDVMQQNVMTIREILDLPLTPVINAPNKFASCRSYRSYKTNSVISPNRYLTVYQNLLTVRDSNPSSNIEKRK